jgi:hypothetical protein
MPHMADAVGRPLGLRLSLPFAGPSLLDALTTSLLTPLPDEPAVDTRSWRLGVGNPIQPPAYHCGLFRGPSGFGSTDWDAAGVTMLTVLSAALQVFAGSPWIDLRFPDDTNP